MSTRSSNLGADKSVTVLAMASRIRVMRDMVDDNSDSIVIARLGQWRKAGPVLDHGNVQGEGMVMRRGKVGRWPNVGIRVGVDIQLLSSPRPQ